MRVMVTGGFFGVSPGAILSGLDDGQLRRVAKLTRPLEGGKLEVVVPFQFKRGEVFEIDGDIPKALLSEVAVEAKASAPPASPPPAGESEEAKPRRRR